MTPATFPRASEKTLRPLAFAVIAAWVIAASLWPSTPGLYYDEVLFVPAASGVSSPFVYRQFHGLPILLMSYIGALKAWIFAPIFAAFGRSPASIRIPCCLLTGLTLCVDYDTVSRLLGLVPALVFTTLCAASPALFVLCRLDWGPVVLMLLFKALCLNLVIRQRDSPSARPIALSIGAFVLGLFDKLNFIWYLAPFAASVLIFLPLRTLAALLARRRLVLLAAAFAALVAFLVLHTARYLVPGEHPPQMSAQARPGAYPDPAVAAVEKPRLAELPSRAARAYEMFVDTFSGRATAPFIFGNAINLPRGIWPATIYILAAAALLPLSLLLRRETQPPLWEPEARLAAFALIAFIFIFLQIVVTPQAGGAHHLFMLFPYPQLILAALFSATLKATSVSAPRSRRGLIAAVVAISCCALPDLTATAAYLHADAAGPSAAMNPRWSTDIYRLASTLAATEPPLDRIVVADWGIANQLLALVGKPRENRILDVWPDFHDLDTLPAAAAKATSARYLGQGRIALVSFTEQKSSYPACYRNIALALALCGRPWQRTFIPDEKHATYEIRWLGQ